MDQMYFCTLTNIVSFFNRKNVPVMKNLVEVGKKSGSSADFSLQGTGSCSAAGSLLTVTFGIN
jgi:hypothetical protein